jgi:ethanolamine utilization cobalamin adenosyltransferase
MSENIDLSKQVYNKEQYTKVIDTSFKQLGVQNIQQQIEDQPTVDDFFNMYNELFYDIPETGEVNSHEFLIKKSSEYIGFEANQEEIIALQAEIAQLRIDLLESQKQVIELQTGTTLANPQ